MFGIGGDKEAIARLEGMPFTLDYQFPRSAVDEIDFILLMRRLRIVTDGCVVLYRHGAVGKRNGKSFPHGPLYRNRTGNA